MNLIQIAIFVIFAIIFLELVKHFFIKKLSKTILLIFIIIALFLTISYYVADSPTFKDNKFVQTGAVIAENLKENIPTEKINISLHQNNFFRN
jgi:hypothetical protein